MSPRQTSGSGDLTPVDGHRTRYARIFAAALALGILFLVAAFGIGGGH